MGLGLGQEAKPIGQEDMFYMIKDPYSPHHSTFSSRLVYLDRAGSKSSEKGVCVCAGGGGVAK